MNTREEIVGNLHSVIPLNETKTMTKIKPNNNNNKKNNNNNKNKKQQQKQKTTTSAAAAAATATTTATATATATTKNNNNNNDDDDDDDDDNDHYHQPSNQANYFKGADRRHTKLKINETNTRSKNNSDAEAARSSRSRQKYSKLFPSLVLRFRHQFNGNNNRVHVPLEKLPKRGKCQDASDPALVVLAELARFEVARRDVLEELARAVQIVRLALGAEVACNLIPASKNGDKIQASKQNTSLN
jgi:hypothetical protein